MQGHRPTLRQLIQAINAREGAGTAYIEQCLRSAREKKHLNCFVEVFEAQSKIAALKAEQCISDTERFPLNGVPFAIKDIFSTAFRSPQAGSLFADLIPKDVYSPVLQRLVALGAHPLGATNLDELCYGMTGLNAHFGGVSNPHDPQKITGGSSSGSAAAVAAGIVPFALGSDTGGSIRVPAALCGVVGFKPTLGLLSTLGAVPLSKTQDCIGFLTNYVEDAEYLLSLLVVDHRKSTTTHSSKPTSGMIRTKIGWIDHPYFIFEDAEKQNAFIAFTELLQKQGMQVIKVDGKFIDACDIDASTITGFEAWDLHGRRFSHQPQLFSPSVAERLNRAKEIQASAYTSAIERHKEFLTASPIDAAGCDFFFTPAIVGRVPSMRDISQNSKAQLDFTLQALHCTRTFSFLGGPAISIPHQDLGGLQLVGKPGTDFQFLQVARMIENLV
jgi:aspartyl-tRNA(Asn)/glutamyl-tRNA(Gln) amidotransferase subunit A